MKTRCVFVALSAALILSLALSGCSLAIVRDSVEEKLGREQHEIPSAVRPVEEEYEESLVEEEFDVAVPRIWQEELYEEEMDVDPSGALHDEIRRGSTPRIIVPGVELEDDLCEEELSVVVPATVPEAILQKGEPGLDVEEALLREELDEEELGVQAPRARVRVLPEEIMDDLYPEG